MCDPRTAQEIREANIGRTYDLDEACDYMEQVKAKDPTALFNWVYEGTNQQVSIGRTTQKSNSGY